MSPKLKSLLAVIGFTLIIILPVAYAIFKEIRWRQTHLNEQVKATQADTTRK